jgi:amidase
MNFSGPDRHVGGQLMAVSGPLARTIADIRIAFEAMAAEDLRDPWWTPVPIDLPLKHKRAALTVNPDGLNVVPEVEHALREAARKLEQAGWQVTETECPPLRKPAELQATLWLAEMRRNPQVIADENDPDANFIYAQMDAMCPETDLNGLLDTIQARATLVREWQLFLDQYPVLICPVSAELPFPDQLDVESPAAFQRIMEAQLTQIGLPLMGLPGLTVNTGMLDNIPIGVQLVAGRYHENALLLAGEAIEQGGVTPCPVDPVLM